MVSPPLKVTASVCEVSLRSIVCCAELYFVFFIGRKQTINVFCNGAQTVWLTATGGDTVDVSTDGYVSAINILSERIITVEEGKDVHVLAEVLGADGQRLMNAPASVAVLTIATAGKKSLINPGGGQLKDGTILFPVRARCDRFTPHKQQCLSARLCSRARAVLVLGARSTGCLRSDARE